LPKNEIFDDRNEKGQKFLLAQKATMSAVFVYATGRESLVEDIKSLLRFAFCQTCAAQIDSLQNIVQLFLK
jgi:hypothetical protein